MAFRDDRVRGVTGSPQVPPGRDVEASERAPTCGARSARPVRGGPDFVIVGHEKCGTTALYRILRSHPQIYMPRLKEPRYLLRERDDPAAALAAGLPRTLDEYLALFADASPQQIVGEASPQYLRSTTAPRRLAELSPDARAIAILREPVDFLRSFHLACVRSGVENERDLRKALLLEERRSRGECIPPGCLAPERLLYSQHVRYVEQLRRFERVLSREQLHVIVYGDLRRDNDRVARGALRFLEVDETMPLEIVNSTGQHRKAVRNVSLMRLAIALKRARRRPEAAPRLLRALNRMMTPRLEAAALRVLYTPPVSVDEELAQELRRRFQPEVAALAEYLQRDLVSEWGYAAASGREARLPVR
jgi:hypothetical protein